MSEQFKREPRYVVFKIKDIHAYLSAAQIDALQTAGETIDAGRAIGGEPPFNAVVVEKDWPEYELVWRMLEARMAGQAARMTELENVFAAAKNLCAVKGRYHTEMAMKALMVAVEIANRKGEQ